ncbi:MAG: TonB-dependent receptor [Saprospiraceae bacterium]|nr:TonB-dependent receptor [Saprospiraceae bacterium]
MELFFGPNFKQLVMMRNFRLLFFWVSIFLVHANPSIGQSIASTSKGKVKLTGQIVNDETLVPLEFATLSLYSRVDSMLIDGTVSDLDGKFELAIAPGLYYIVIDFLSYQQKIIPEVNIPVNKKSFDLGKVGMSESSKMLEEVEVIAEKSQMQLKLDKRVFNVGKDLSNTGANAAELLDNVPSVTVDVEGNVSLRGSENVRILIDGKPSGLVGISSADALRQLQGDIVQSVEVITNPSARYDAEGEVGIINIVLKKEKREGVNGSFSLNAGYPENFLQSKYEKEKI